MAAPAANGSQPNTARDFGNQAAEWSAWYAQYLARATGQSARTLELFQEVLERVSTGQLGAAALQDLLPAFATARGSEYSSKLAELSFRFFSGLVQIGGAYSHDQAELIMPGVSVPPVPPPQFDPADPVKWFQQLTDYGGQLNARLVQAYKSHAERVAAGDAAPNHLQQATSGYMAQRLPEHLRLLGQLYFELLGGINDLRARFEEDYLAGVLATAKGPDQEGPFLLNLVASLGGTASASLALTNTRERRAMFRGRLSELRRADGVGPAFDPKVTFTPPDGLDLGPGEEGRLRVSLELDPADFQTDRLYVGSLYVTGHGEPDFEVPLRITPKTASTTEPNFKRV